MSKSLEKEKKRALAKDLYVSGYSIQDLADKIGVTRQTVGKWCKEDGWQEIRAARNITRPELVNKLLLAIDKLICQVNDSNDPTMIAGLGDKLSKLSSVIQKLDKQTTVVDTIDVFMAFSKWLEYRAQTDDEITPELRKTINRLQDTFILEQINK
jgi:transposase